MTARIFAYVAHKGGVPDDSAAELLAAARKIDAEAKPTALVCGWGSDVGSACEALQVSYEEIWKIANENLSYPNAELIRQALTAVVPPHSILLLPHNHFGLDLAPGLSVKLGATFVSDISDIAGKDDSHLDVVRQEFGGQMSTHVRCDVSDGIVITIRPGAFKPLPANANAGVVVDKSSSVGTLVAKRRYLQTIVPEGGDVDITKHDILVSIGRGIQKQENVVIAQELADALGAAVSCSRPVVDAKWMEKSRQVGSSGKTVKPKVYLACGISGSFQHLAGIKGNPLLIAINKNAKAPIFQVADFGVIADILEFLPALTNRVREVRNGKGAIHTAQ
jgi:electron transfer flavoprotein alpha subunit